MNSNHFSIIGGGIAGLATALAVANAGSTATIYEKAAAFEPVGAGLQLGPNAVRALKKLGVWDEVEPFTFSPPAIHIRDGRSGKLLKELKLGRNFETRFGQPYRVAHRADLHQALVNVVSASSHTTLHMNQEISMADWRSTGPVIGADGVWSPSRENLFPGSAAIVSTDAIYRSLTPALNVRGVNMECVNLWLYPGGHVVHYPVGKERKLNLVAVTQGKPPLEHFANASPSLMEFLQGIASWSNWPAAYVQPLNTWSGGLQTLLVGDAAHATLPYLAQGAAMALEDAASLFEFLLSESNVGLVFQKLFEARSKRTRRLHHASLQAGKIYHLNGIEAQLRNAAIGLIPSHLQLSRMAWIYK
jgi:2-polyprenyl-6-methoxyphenol hydroxylase-like FAD-dependent oxidoreductase